MRVATSLVVAALLLATDAVAQDAEPTTLVPAGATWRYIVGTARPPDRWRERDFDDSAWRAGPSGIGYGDDDDATVIPEMRDSALTLYMRHAFTVPGAPRHAALVLAMTYDDGFVAYLNGVEVARRSMPAGEPSHSTRAADHEASGSELIELTDAARSMRHGENVLAVEVHNASMGSSDLSSLPVLSLVPVEREWPAAVRDEGEPPPFAVEPPRESTPDAPPSRRLTARTTFATYHASDYFQSEEGSTATPVTGMLARQEVRFVPARRPALRLTLRAELDRAGSLGTSQAASARLESTHGPHRVQLDAHGRLNRPAFVLAGRIAREDSWGAAATYRFRGPGHVEWSGWAGWTQLEPTLDPRRESRDAALGASARFLRNRRALSPEVGLEVGRRNAKAATFDYEQRRYLLELHSAPTPRSWLTALLRWTEREYTTDEPVDVDPNVGREDTRGLARVVAGFRATSLVEVTGFYAHEDGDSSRPGRSFESDTVWAGVTLSY